MIRRERGNAYVPAEKRADGDAAASYFNHFRGDVLRHVPDSARVVLSIGCGAGATEGELVKRGVEVVGIELDPAAATVARSRGIVVFQGDVCKIHEELDNFSFDCLIYADLLEHLLDPVEVLSTHVQRLVPGGVVVVSVPNFRHHSVFRQLFLRGWVPYAQAGIFDRTHVRLTTRKMVCDWFRQTGLLPVSCEYRISRRREKLISACLFGLACEFLASQLILTGRKPLRMQDCRSCIGS